MDASQKLAQFLEEVNQSIDLRIQEDQEKAQAQADALLRESEERSIASAERTLSDAKTEIAAKYQKRISQTGFRCKTALLQRRQALLQELFEKLEQKLTDFVASAQYESWMVSLLTKHQPEAEAVVLLREQDMPMQEKLAAVCQNKVEFRVDNSIHMGGLSVLSADGSICENRTLDEAYLMQTRNFYRNYRLDGGAEK